MLITTTLRNKAFLVFAALTILVAAYHFIGIFHKFDESPIWRHSLFVCINLFCTYGLLKRPKYFVFIVAILLVQQYYSHGIYMVNLWNEKHQVHWESVFVLVFLPIALILLIEDFKIKRIIALAEKS